MEAVYLNGDLLFTYLLSIYLKNAFSIIIEFPYEINNLTIFLLIMPAILPYLTFFKLLFLITLSVLSH